jgi:hypothetical protein
MILLYHADVLFTLIPKRVLAPRDVSTLRVLATSAGVSGVGRS